MQQQISVVTLGIDDLARSKCFYCEGFGWRPVFENEEIAFYQMNGLVLGTWMKAALSDDMQMAATGSASAAFALAHNVHAKADVELLIESLLTAGGELLRAADEPPHGGYRAMWPIPTAMPGKSPGTLSGRSTRKGMSASRPDTRGDGRCYSVRDSLPHDTPGLHDSGDEQPQHRRMKGIVGGRLGTNPDRHHHDPDACAQYRHRLNDQSGFHRSRWRNERNQQTDQQHGSNCCFCCRCAEMKTRRGECAPMHECDRAEQACLSGEKDSNGFHAAMSLRS